MYLNMDRWDKEPAGWVMISTVEVCQDLYFWLHVWRETKVL